MDFLTKYEAILSLCRDLNEYYRLLESIEYSHYSILKFCMETEPKEDTFIPEREFFDIDHKLYEKLIDNIEAHIRQLLTELLVSIEEIQGGDQDSTRWQDT